MATILKASKAVAYYKGAVNTSIPLAGNSGGYRVMKYTFTMPATGATKFSLSITGVSMYSSSYPTLRFFLTESETSHINADANTTEYDGTLIRSAAGSGESGQHKYTSDEVEKILLPNKTYYLYIFAGNTYARSAYFPYDGLQYKTELATIIVDGTATYTVSYDANGGTGAPPSQTKTHGTTLKLSDTRPTKSSTTSTGYKVLFDANGGGCDTEELSSQITTSFAFDKWNTKADGTGTGYSAGGNYTANESAKLYAQYNGTTTNGKIMLPTPTRSEESVAGYTVMLDANGGTVNVDRLTSTRKASYFFKGWATSKESDSGVFGEYTPTTDTKLYAIWEASYTNNMVILPEATKAGAKFKGWSTSPAAESGITGEYVPEENITLYAVWEAVGTLYRDNGEAWQQAQIYRDNGTEWDAVSIYKDIGTGWVPPM